MYFIEKLIMVALQQLLLLMDCIMIISNLSFLYCQHDCDFLGCTLYDLKDALVKTETHLCVIEQHVWEVEPYNDSIHFININILTNAVITINVMRDWGRRNELADGDQLLCSIVSWETVHHMLLLITSIKDNNNINRKLTATQQQIELNWIEESVTPDPSHP